MLPWTVPIIQERSTAGGGLQPFPLTYSRKRLLEEGKDVDDLTCQKSNLKHVSSKTVDFPDDDDDLPSAGLAHDIQSPTS